MDDLVRSKDNLLKELAQVRRRMEELERALAHQPADFRPPHGEETSEILNTSARFSGTIDLGSLFAMDVSETGTFDMRGQIWAATFLELIESLPIPAFLINRSLEVQYANQASSSLSPEYDKIIGTSFASLMLSFSTAQDVEKTLTSVLTTGKPSTSEAVLQMTGRQIWARMVFWSVRFVRESFILVLVEDLAEEKKQIHLNEQSRKELEQRVAERTAELVEANERLKQEITERINTERDLVCEKEKFQSLAESSPFGLAMIRHDGAFAYINPKFREMFGYELTDIPDGRTWFRRAYPDSGHRKVVIGAWIEDANPTRPGVRGPRTFSVTCKNGTEKIVRFIAVTLKAGDHILTCEDITELKRSQDALLESENKLRAIEEDLSKLEKLEALGILAGGIAHDFNNFLTAILGNISLARMHCESPDQALARLAEAEKACLRAQDLTQQLLTFSRGGAPVTKKQRIQELIRDSCLFSVRGTHVGCTFSVAPDLWPVEVDAGQIGQVLNNLMINAVQAMPQGGVIHIEAKNVALKAYEGLPVGEGNYVRLLVRDQGVGIPEKILPRIFDPYFTTKQKGSGLGLASCYSIIRNHGGAITVDSEVGVGTDFTVYLPASEAGIQPDEPLESSFFRGSGRILLMDDDDAIRSFAGELLSMMGFEVVLAKDGREAIQLYVQARKESRSFDAVILDLTVPGGMGGLEALRRLTDIDPGVKAVVSSGYSSDPVMSKYQLYGFSGVVAKPYTHWELAETLRDVLAPGAE
jgi:PAS domain S-box-containing protein